MYLNTDEVFELLDGLAENQLKDMKFKVSWSPEEVTFDHIFHLLWQDFGIRFVVDQDK